MKKYLFLFVTTFIMSVAVFSQPRVSLKTIKMKGGYGYLPTSAVSVGLAPGNTLVTTFYKNMEDVTITVKKENGEIVSVQNVNAAEFDSVITEIKDYTPGNYIIEVEAPEGSLEGNF